jgi:DNA modification methylase
MHFLDGKVELICGDCIEALRAMPADSVDSCVCDPPYHLTSIVNRCGKEDSAEMKTAVFQRASAGFMGKQWDGGDIAFRVETWRDVIRVLKPGGYLVAFGGTRTSHRMVCAIEDAGFEIRDQIGWVYGAGFPKSLNVSKKLNGQRCACERPEGAASVLQHGLRRMQHSRVPSTELAGEERQEVLLKGVSEHGVHRAMLRPEYKKRAKGGEERSLEGRSNASQEAGELCLREIRALPETSSKHGQDGWICDGTQESNGGVGGPSPSQGGVRSSCRSRPVEQSEIELGTVAGQSKPQDGGAWQNCGRCGKPIIPDGLGTALKPAWEPVCLARKPLDGTNVQNVRKHGTGAINIDGCRIHGDDAKGYEYTVKRTAPGAMQNATGKTKFDDVSFTGKTKDGRWPANLIHDGSDEVLAAFPQSDGGGDIHKRSSPKTSGVYGDFAGDDDRWSGYGDEGSAARFFYSAKADSDDRIGSKHPTVKPVDLMRYLVRLVTPPGGVVLDCFAGTGTTGEAAWREGMRAILIEREEEYQADIAERMRFCLAGPDEKRREIIKRRGLADENAGPLFGGTV